MLFGFDAFASSPFSTQTDLNKVFLTGNSVTSAVGNITLVGKATVLLTGNAVTASVGGLPLL
jgi:hypothetical protein